MKAKLLLLVLLSFNLAFSQNQSLGFVNPAISPATGAPLTEIFRFRPGVVTQLDDPFNQNFGFTNSRWFAMGNVPIGTQNFYGLRFQLPSRALVMGYTSTSNMNPVIQWIGTDSNLGNLEFKVGNSFGAANSPGSDLLVATMTNGGNTIFGNPAITGNNAKVSIENDNQNGLFIQNNGQTGLKINSQAVISGQLTQVGMSVATNEQIDTNIGGVFETSGGIRNTGLIIITDDGKFNRGVDATVSGSNSAEAIAVRGKTFGQGSFEAAIYGETPQNNGSQYAAYFNGETFSTTGWGPSDAKLKENIKQEENVLERLSKLTAVTYNFKNMTELNLPRSNQHGFIAQELAQVFPELTQDISKPVFDKEGKVVSTFEFKSVNYTGLISVLTAAVNELNTEIKDLKEELADLKAAVSSGDLARPSETTINKVVLEQNIPNPFSDRTTIKYQFQENATKASLIIFDMNGGIKKEFPLTENKGEITVSASQIGKGLFIYSLVQNGQILETKKMIIQ